MTPSLALIEFTEQIPFATERNNIIQIMYKAYKDPFALAIQKLFKENDNEYK